MEERNLELELADLEKSRQLNLVFLITGYGHGYCHELAAALSYQYELPIGLIKQADGSVVHSCVILPDGLTLDAYGLNSVKTTLRRYSKFVVGKPLWEVCAYVPEAPSPKVEKGFYQTLQNIQPLLEYLHVGELELRNRSARRSAHV